MACSWCSWTHKRVRERRARFDEPNTNEMNASFQAASVNQNVAEIQERCETKTRQDEARREACVTRIEEVDDVEHEKSEEQSKQEEEEFGEPRETTRKDDPRTTNMTHLPFRSWCRNCIKGRGEMRSVAKQLKKRDKSQKSFGLHVH